MGNIKLIIFDLDGTLIDAYGAIASSFNFVMRKLGYPKQSYLTIRRSVGWGDKNLLAPFILEKDLNKAVQIYRRHHARALLSKSRLLPGAKMVLALLKNKGYLITVASNRPTRFSRILIKHLKIEKYFDFLLCADKLKKGKPHPEIIRRIMNRFKVTASRVVYVGDMVIDAQAGRRAGVKTVIVTTGSSHKEEIKKEKPYKIISGIRALLKLF
jgi:phosphoglycolate phosphatase